MELLIVALKDVSVCRRAAWALGKIGEPATEPLMAALKHKDPGVCQEAAKALGEIGDLRAVKPLIATFRVKNAFVRNSVTEVLAKIGRPAVEPLIAALRDEDPFMRRGAARALGGIGDVQAVEPLIAALKDEEWLVRDRAAQALGQIGDAKAMEPLTAALSDERSSVCECAAQALGKVGDGRAATPLLRLAASHRFANRSAIIALQHVLERAAVSFAPDDLRAITRVSGVFHQYGLDDVTGLPASEKVDCSQVKRLARQELSRRGLEA